VQIIALGTPMDALMEVYLIFPVFVKKPCCYHVMAVWLQFLVSLRQAQGPSLSRACF